MKTRIKVIKYGDGKVEYVPQEMGFKFHWGYFVPFFGQLFLFFEIWDRWTPLYLKTTNNHARYDYCCHFQTIEEAQSVIDKSIIEDLNEKEEKRKKKISNKVISKSYIKYP
jgi:hypothetical protein